MKFNCGPTRAEKTAAKEAWHEWFAWFPVRVYSGDCRWLETVARKGVFNPDYSHYYWTWTYKALRIIRSGP